MTKSQVRKLRKRKRHKQKQINTQLKRKLFGHLFMAPCFYCKIVFFVSDLTIEHMTPLCLGGTNDPANIALACSPCNHERGRVAWSQKQEMNKRYYEQYYAQYREQDRSRFAQDSGTPPLHCQREGV